MSNSRTTSDAERPRWAPELVYSGVNLPLALVQLPVIGGLLPALYARHAGLSLVVLGTLLVALRIFDAVIDPLIGFYSDQTRARWGRRKPWIAGGAVLACIGTLAMYQPAGAAALPEGAPRYLYFALAYLVLVLGWSMAEIAHNAWFNDLVTAYGARSRVATMRYVAGIVGSVLFYALPFAPWFPDTQFTPEVLQWAAGLVIVLMVLTVPMALRGLPDAPAAPPAGAAAQREGLRDMWASVAGNRPFMRYAAVQAAQGLASGLVSGLFFIYIDSYLHAGDRFAHVMLAVFAVSLVGALFWLRVTHHMDKHRVMAWCALVTVLTNVAMAFIAPGEHAALILGAVFCLSAFAGAGAMAAQASLLADVADFGRWRTGKDHAGNYFAVQALALQCCVAVGGGLGLVIAGLFGFTVEGPNSAWATSGFFFAIVWLPAVLNLASAAGLWNFAVDRRAQRAVRRRLDARDARLAQPQRATHLEGVT